MYSLSNLRFLLLSILPILTDLGDRDFLMLLFPLQSSYLLLPNEMEKQMIYPSAGRQKEILSQNILQICFFITSHPASSHPAFRNAILAFLIPNLRPGTFIATPTQLPLKGVHNAPKLSVRFTSYIQ